MDRTEQSQRRGSTAAALLLPCAYLPWLALDYLGRPVGSFDEPLLYVGARALRHGAWPNIDFASVYPPLNYVPVALGFSLLGETALAARAAQIGAYWLLLAALAAWFVSLGARGARLALQLLAALVLTAALPIQASVFGVALGLLSLLGYLHALAQPSGRARAALMAGAGFCAGLALFTRVSFGLYAAAAFAADQALELWRARAEGGRHARRALAADAAPLWAGAALVVVALAAAYGAHLRDMFEQTVTVLLRALDRHAYAAPALEPSLRGVVRFFTRGWWLLPLPLGWLAWRSGDGRAKARYWGLAAAVLAAQLGLAVLWPAGLPLLVGPVAALILQGGLARSERERLGRPELVALLAVCFFTHYYLSRTDLSHQLASTAALVLLLPLARPARATAPTRRALPRLEAALLAAFLLALAWPSFWSSHPTVGGVRAGGALLAEHVRASDAARLALRSPPPALAALYPDPSEQVVARALRERTGDSEPVYVGVEDHALSSISNLRLLWLAGRPLGARHYMLLGEISNTAAAQQSIASDLESRGVRWAVTWRSPDDGRGLARPLARGPSIVDEYLRARFRVAARFGDFTLLERTR